MKEMRVASIAFAAYLVSSAERTSMRKKAIVVALERRVKRAHDLYRPLVVGAHHDAVRPHEVLKCGPFLEELGVRYHREGRVHAAPAELFRKRGAHLVRVPTGTVDLFTITRYSVMCRPMARAAESTC